MKDVNLDLEKLIRDKDSLVILSSLKKLSIEIALFKRFLNFFYYFKEILSLVYFKIADHMTEKEHLKNEICDMRHQLQHVLAEVSHLV